MRNRNAKRKSTLKREKIVVATPVSISKHPSTWQSVYDELSSSTQASIVSQSPQAKDGRFPSRFHPPNRTALKHPRWCNAAEVMGSTLVRTMRVDQSGTLRRGRTENSSLRAGNGHSMISRISPTYPSPTVKVDSHSRETRPVSRFGAAVPANLARRR